jgi:putative ABC transport system permease protein
MAKERWYTAAAVIALALGIGVNAFGFAILDAAFFRPLPFHDADRLLMVSWLNQPGRRVDVSYPELQEWRAQSRTFAGLAAYRDAAMNVSDDGAAAEEVRGAWVTANMFGLLGEQPLIGRDFAPGDEGRSAEAVAIIGYRLWQDRYAADPNVLGRVLRVNGQAATIVGVMPDEMRFPDHTQLWVPVVATDAQEERTARIFTVCGRLRDGTTHKQAQAEFSGIAKQHAAAYSDAYKDIVGVRVETITDAFVGGLMRRMFITIMGAVIFVLLIACANVANLLLARSAYRAREIAVRMAMGATRWRVVRQLLVESVVLGVLGGSFGLFLTSAIVQLFDLAMADAGGPYWIRFTLNYAVFGYVAAICVLTAVLFGLAPSLHVSKANNHEVLKEGARGSAGHARLRWFSATMVVTEVALTIVLLGGAGLMIRSFVKLYSVDLGIDLDRLMTMSMRLPEAKYESGEARRAFFDQLEPRLSALPGVESVAVTTGVPPLDGGERLLEIDRAGSGSTQARFVSTVAISPQFFEVLRLPLVAGRTFAATDGAPGAETVVINERLAAQFFPGEDPIGRRVRFTQRQAIPGKPTDVWRTIVGISPSIPQGSPQDLYLNSVVYVPYRQEAPSSASLLVRSALAPGVIMNAVRREVQAIDRDQPVFTIQTLEQRMSADRWPLRIFGSLFSVFAMIGLLLSAVGLYAVMAYSVAQRTQEIGVRMAVGAQAWHVWWLILKRGVIQLAIGVPIGLAGALAMGIVLERMLVDMTPGDPITLAGITAVLVLVSLAACVLPARRATRVDPMTALRAE